VAAKDISMAGLIGSLVMLLEYAQLGATVDLDGLPRPDGVDLEQWLTCFPCYGFLLCVPEGREEQCAHPFHQRGLEAAVVGTLDNSGQVRTRLSDVVATVFNLRTESVTGLRSTELV
jgi:selenophosphate synthetase-related protein